jgi:hypothetical protein
VSSSTAQAAAIDDHNYGASANEGNSENGGGFDYNGESLIVAALDTINSIKTGARLLNRAYSTLGVRTKGDVKATQNFENTPSE